MKDWTELKEKVLTYFTPVKEYVSCKSKPPNRDESMKKIVLAAWLCLLAVLAPAIIIENGSLRDFLMGSEPACAYDNWISHLAEGIASPNYNLYAPYDVQTNGFGNFRLPTATDLIYWNNMADLFVAGDYDGAQAILTANSAPFEIVQLNDTDTGRTYVMLREIPNPGYFDDNGTLAEYDDEWGAFTYGWGLFIYNPQGSKPIIITVPHPCDDFPTPATGYEALNVWDARYLLINGSGREVRWTNEGSYTNSKSLADPLRNAIHPFNTLYKKFADSIRALFGLREFSAQIHSYDWNRHQGYANCQISAGNPRPCPNLPIRDLSPLKRDLINAGQHLMIPANTVGIHADVWLNDFYSVNYSTHDFTFSDGENAYPVNDQVDLPAYTQNQHMLYTQSGTTDYDIYEPFFHLEMDELPNCYDETDNVYRWFYGWDAASQNWDMEGLFSRFMDYYGRWVYDLEPVLVDMFALNDDQTPPTPGNLTVHNQSLNSVTLSWAKSHGFDFDSYEILYATEPISTDNFQIFNRANNAFLASPDCEMITVPNLANANPYYFKIRAKDKNGNVSALSNEVNTNLAPANITAFTAHGLDGTVRLYWQVNGQTNNQGFKIYRRDAVSNFTLVDSWLTNPALANPTANSFEWWDNEVTNGSAYTYKISSTNLLQVEYFHNYPASAVPRPIHAVTISNMAGTLSDQVFFSANPFATDGNDAYWDVTKGNPGTTYVWNAFYEQYWSTNGTNLSREVKGDYDSDNQIKTWVLRVRSDQLETLNITASGNFSRAEKLYLQDGGTYHNLLAGPYQYSNANSNVRTMTLHWGNMQPRATFASLENKVYQGGNNVTFGWSFQYPFLIDHAEISVINASDSLLLSDTVPPTQTSFPWLVPASVAEMQDCRFVVDIVAVDGVRSRYLSPYRFSLLPQMILAYNEPGLKMRSNPWLNTDLSFDQVFGPSLAYQLTPDGGWGMTEDYDFGTAYWVMTDDVSFYSNTMPLQNGTYYLDLAPGWNFLPNPHLCAYDLEDLSFALSGQSYSFSEMLSQELISPAVFVWRGTDYEKTNRIEPWEAFLIYYNGSTDLVPQIRFLPFFEGPGMQAPPPAFQLRMELAGAHPAGIELGLHPLASEAVDFRFDHPRPLYPPLTNGSALWIHHANADSTAAWNLCSEYRRPFSAPEQAEYFNIRLHAGTEAPREISFITEGIGDQWQILLMLNDVPYYLDGQDTITWQPPAAGTYEGYIRVSNYQVPLQDLVQSPISALTAYPNPFNPDVSIAFNLALSSEVSVDVFNIRGQKVRSLLQAKLSGGNHSQRWDGRDDNGRGVASGVYFARVRTQNETKTIKMMLMK